MKTESLTDFVCEDRFMEDIDWVTGKSQTMEEPTEKTVPEMSYIQESQREERQKEQALLLQLQNNLEQEREAERTGVQRPLPFEPEDLEKRLLERMSDLGAQQAYCQTMMQSLRTILEYEEPMSSMAARTKAKLEYLQRLQPELAQRMIKLWENYQAQKRWKSRPRNTYTNVPLSRTSTTDHLHPNCRRAGFQNSYQFAPHGDLADWLRQGNFHLEEVFKDEELPIRQWGQDWDVPR